MFGRDGQKGMAIFAFGLISVVAAVFPILRSVRALAPSSVPRFRQSGAHLSQTEETDIDNRRVAASVPRFRQSGAHLKHTEETEIRPAAQVGDTMDFYGPKGRITYTGKGE